MSQAQAAAHFMGHAVQSELRVAASTGFTYLPMKAGGLQLDRPSKVSDELYGYEGRLARAQNSSVSGSVPLLLYYSQIGRYFDNFLKRTTSEVNSYTIGATNNKLYFDRSGPFTATISSATYSASGLATAIASAMNTADATQNPDYTCTYSTTTKKFTIAAAGGSNFTLTNATTTTAIWSTIGFLTGDYSTPGTTFTGAAQAPAVYDHLWKPDLTAQFITAQSQQYGLTLLDHRDWFTYQAIGCMVNSCAIGYAENDPHAPGITFGIKGCTLERIAAVSPSFATDVPASPDAAFTLTVVVNGKTHSGYPTKNFQIQITPAVDMRYAIGDFYPRAVIHTGKITSTVTFGWDLEDDASDGGGGTNLNEDWETAWLDADATASVTVTQIGQVLRTGFSEGMTLVLPAMRPTGGTSQAAAGTIEQPFQAMSQYDRTNSAAGIQITLRSTEVLP